MDTHGNQNAAACMVPPHFDAANHQHAILLSCTAAKLACEDAVDRIEEAHQLHGAENNLNEHHMNNGADSSDVDLQSTVDADDSDNISVQEAVSDSNSYDVPSASDEDASNFGGVHDQSDYDWLEEEVDNNEEKKKKLIRDLKKWVIECGISRTHINNLLVILKTCNELAFLPNDYRALLTTARNVTTKETPSRQLFSLRLKIAIRGFRASSHFVVGIYHGSTKPKFVNDYLRDFITEAILLESDGVVFRESKIKVSVSAFICDLPARSFITKVQSHNAYFGCPKCETKGSFYNPMVNNARSRRVTYPQLDALPRTDQSFRNKSQPEHHHEENSLLEELNLDLGSHVPVDPMHLTDLGVNRKLFVSWTHGKYHNVKLSRVQRGRLAERIECIRSFIPNDFPRKHGALQLLDKWKSTCFRIIKLRLRPVLLRHILLDNLYDHFLLFHVAMVLLSNEQECVKPEVTDYCSQLLKRNLSIRRFVSSPCEIQAAWNSCSEAAGKS
ncbi:Uncharacterized protein APZ42_025240 [Daphnia magna]|uniref:Transposase domain-containing protein n=1 Tax=Daphnia magna TaxID=35525 RepID=A0A164TBG6_9CRUS|nr:Uncharacterized protein APZ42_025240 [Daphnia magna]